MLVKKPKSETACAAYSGRSNTVKQLLVIYTFLKSEYHLVENFSIDALIRFEWSTWKVLKAWEVIKSNLSRGREGMGKKNEENKIKTIHLLCIKLLNYANILKNVSQSSKLPLFLAASHIYAQCGLLIFLAVSYL